MIEFFNTILHHITKYQQEFNATIAANFREDSLTSSLSILGISLLYGIIHALGPGHGKALVASYFLTHKQSYKKAFKMGYMISGIHATSALFITFLLYFVLDVLFSKTFQETSLYMGKASGVLIIMIALYLFFQQHQEHQEDYDAKKSDMSVAFSAGVVPCPGVMTVVLFSLMMGKIFVGILAAIMMSIGMGVTISLAAILAVGTREKSSEKISYFFPYIGNTMILILGLYLTLN